MPPTSSSRLDTRSTLLAAWACRGMPSLAAAPNAPGPGIPKPAMGTPPAGRQTKSKFYPFKCLHFCFQNKKERKKEEESNKDIYYISNIDSPQNKETNQIPSDCLCITKSKLSITQPFNLSFKYENKKYQLKARNPLVKNLKHWDKLNIQLLSRS